MNENLTESMFLSDFQCREFCFICINYRHCAWLEAGERIRLFIYVKHLIDRDAVGGVRA